MVSVSTRGVTRQNTPQIPRDLCNLARMVILVSEHMFLFWGQGIYQKRP